MDYQSKHSGASIEGILDIVDTSGDGTKFLSDDGTYKEIGSPQPTGGTLVITVTSNQAQPDASLQGAKVSVKVGDVTTQLTYSGETLTHTVPVGDSYQVIPGDVEGYLTPSVIDGVSSAGIIPVTLSWSTTLVSLTYTASGDDISTLPDASCSLSKDGEPYSTFTIEPGDTHPIHVPDVSNSHDWVVSFNETVGATPPDDISIDAGGGTKAYSFTYSIVTEETHAYWIEYHMTNGSTPTPMTAVVNRGGNQDVINDILSRFRRCLALPQSDGTAVICYLNADDSTKWPDGTSVSGSLEYARRQYYMVHFPKYYYRCGEVYDDGDLKAVKIWFSNIKVSDSYKEEPECLIGVFEASSNLIEDDEETSAQGERLTSASGCVSVGDVSATNAYLFAQNIGYNWGLISYRAHRTIANMFCAKYGTTNISTDNPVIPCSGCGRLYNEFTGFTLSLGNTDGRSDDAQGKSSNFLGIEDCYGGLGEWVQGINVLNRTSNKHIVYDDGFHPDMDETELEELGVSGVRVAGENLPSNEGWISNIAAGLNNGGVIEPDVIPMYWSASSTTGFCDYSYKGLNNQSYTVMVRSGDSSYTDRSGVFYADMRYAASESNNKIGARIGFYGTIVVKEKADFLATQIGWDH